MTHEQIDAMARMAGEETGEVFPSNTTWRRRFVELLEEHFVRGMSRPSRQSGLLASAVNPAHVKGVAVGPVGQSVMIVESVALAKQAAEIAALREALSYYAESSNWSRKVVMVGKAKHSWKKPAVASDRGGLARLVLMQQEGTK